MKVGMLCLVAFAGALCSGQDIKVLINGEEVKFKGKGPVIVVNRVLVPLRGVLEKIGAQISWDPDTLKLTAVRANRKVELWVGSRHAMVNDEEKLFDSSVSMAEGRVMVPLRFLAETLGDASVGWRGKEKTVVIKGKF